MHASCAAILNHTWYHICLLDFGKSQSKAANLVWIVPNVCSETSLHRSVTARKRKKKKTIKKKFDANKSTRKWRNYSHWQFDGVQIKTKFCVQCLTTARLQTIINLYYRPKVLFFPWRKKCIKCQSNLAQ